MPITPDTAPQPFSSELPPLPLQSPSAFPMEEASFAKIPFSEIVQFGQRNLLYRDLFSVSWLLGRFCNYRCSYCWPYARSDQKDHRPTSLILSTMDEIKRQARKRGFNSFHISFSGGEPTMHPGYLEILQHYANDAPNCNYQSVHMTSNCSAGIGWFEKYVAVTAQMHRVSVTASFHAEFAKREQFLKKLLFLQKNDIQVTINMVMVPERFSVLWQEAQFFHDAGINVTLKPQSNPTATQVVAGYTDEQLRLLQQGLPQCDYTSERLRQFGCKSQRPKAQRCQSSQESVDQPVADTLIAASTLDAKADFNLNSVSDSVSNINLNSNSKSNSNSQLQSQTHPPTISAQVPPVMQIEMRDREGNKWYLDQAERLNAFSFNRFRGWECSAGFRSLIIREPDGLIKRSYSCGDQALGHIETGFKLFDEPKICTTASCLSSADSKIPKRKLGAPFPLWPGDLSAEK